MYVKYFFNYYLLGKNLIGRYMKNLINICLLGKNMIIRYVKYIINFCHLAKDILCRQPDNWEAKLAEIQRKLKWDPEHQPFANVSAQVGIWAEERKALASRPMLYTLDFTFLL